MFYEIYLFMQLCFISMFMLILSYKYMLVLLMMNELVILNISVVMFSIYSLVNMEFFLLYYLVFSVCEGVLDLSLLVMIIRFYGNELYYAFNMSKF